MKKHIPVNEHPNKAIIKRQKEKAYKDRVIADKIAHRKSIEAICAEQAAYTNDPRYKGRKFLYTEWLAGIISKRDNLINTTKTDKEYFKQGIICDTTMENIRTFLNMPKSFETQLKALQDEDKRKKGDK